MLILNPHDPVPLYRQIYEQLRTSVLTGKLPAHARLPSVRALADELVTSRITVEGAYQELCAEGYIYSKPRSGYFVSALDREAAPRSLRPPRPRARSAAPVASYLYDFHPARLDPGSFPAPLWRKRFLEALRTSARELVEYGDPQGDWGLRSALRDYLERSRGVLCAPEQIVICAGLQQSLDIVATLLQGTHAALAVEDPGYFLPRVVFANHGLTILPLPVRANGLDLELLQASAATVAYVTPSHQLPMGYVMPIAQRLRLIEWAASGGKLILEDDYDSELRYHGKPIPSLQGLRPEGQIVYLGTFSKILSPALRVSYLVLPQGLLADYHQRCGHYFATVSLLEQRTLAGFMEQGDWERHVRRMRTIYQKKHDRLLQTIVRHFGDRALVVGQGAGLHVVLQLVGVGIQETELIARARQQGVNLFPFSATCASGVAEPTMLMLGFGGLTVDQIEPGIALLARICREAEAAG